MAEKPDALMHLSQQTSGFGSTMRSCAELNFQKTANNTRTPIVPGGANSITPAETYDNTRSTRMHSPAPSKTHSKIPQPKRLAPKMDSSDDDLRLGSRVRNLRAAWTAPGGARAPHPRGDARNHSTQHQTLKNPLTNLSGGHQTVSSFFGAPLKGRPITKQIAAGSPLTGTPAKLHFLHPYIPRNLQYPLSLRRNSGATTSTTANTIENSWLTGVHSESSPELYSFTVYATLSPKNPNDTAEVLRACLAAQIACMRTTLTAAGLTASTEGLAMAEITPIPISKYTKPFFDDRIGDPTADLPNQVSALPFAHTLTLSSTAPAAAALLALTSRQAEWTASMTTAAETDDPTPEHIQMIQTQIPTLIRRDPAPPLAASVLSSLTCPAFHRAKKSPEYCIRFFQEAALYTFRQFISAPQSIQACTTAESIHSLPINVQALLQILDATQPAGTPPLQYSSLHTIEYRATLLPTNSIQLQSQPIIFKLKHPTAGVQEFTYNPPGSKSLLPGDTAWTTYHRCTILVQCEHLFPWPEADLKDGKIPKSHPLYSAIILALTKNTPVQSTIDPDHRTPLRDLIELAYAPNDTTVTSFPKRPNSSMQTNFIISVISPLAYCLLATANNPIHVETNTYSEHRGARRPVTIPIHFHPAPRSILGRHYYEILTHPNVQSQGRMDNAEMRGALGLQPLTLKRNPQGQVTGLKAGPTQLARWAYWALSTPDVLILGDAEASNILKVKRKASQRTDANRQSKQPRTPTTAPEQPAPPATLPQPPSLNPPQDSEDLQLPDLSSDQETVNGEETALVEVEFQSEDDPMAEDFPLPAYLTPADIPAHIPRKLFWAHLKAANSLTDEPPQGCTKDSIISKALADIDVEARLPMPAGCTDADIPDGITRGFFIETLKTIQYPDKMQKAEAIETVKATFDSLDPDPQRDTQQRTTPPKKTKRGKRNGK